MNYFVLYIRGEPVTFAIGGLWSITYAEGRAYRFPTKEQAENVHDTFFENEPYAIVEKSHD